MTLDARMASLRRSLFQHEVDIPDDLAAYLPRCDGTPGRCFQEAEAIVMMPGKDCGLILVHGKCNDLDHAWVETADGLIYDAVLGRLYPWNVYRSKLRAKAHHRYTYMQAKAMVENGETCGPWTDAERQQAGVICS